MNISGVLAAIGRRWYVALVVLAATGVAAAQLWQAAEPEYSSSVAVSVVRSPGMLAVQQSEDPLVVQTNPYASEATLAALLADSIENGMLNPSDGAVGTTVEVRTNPARAESWFTVSVTGATADAVIARMQDIQDQSPQIVASIQVAAGATEDQVYTALLSREPTAPDEAYPSRMRVVLGVALAGLLATAMLCVLVDGVVRAANGRRAERRSDPGAARARRGRGGSPAASPSQTPPTQGPTAPGPPPAQGPPAG